MELLLVFLCSFSVLLVSYFLFKGTVLDLNPKKGLVWGSLYYKNLVFVFIPLFMVQIYPLSELSNNPPPASKEMINRITIYSILAILFFTLTLAFLLRHSILAREISRVDEFNRKYNLILRFGYLAAFFGLFIFSIGVLFLGHQHALIKAIVSGENLLSVRLGNAYSSNLPSQVTAFFSIAYKVSAVSGGVAFALGKRYQAATLLFLALFISSVGGAKAPLATAIIFFTLSFVVVRPPNFTFKTFFWYFFVYPSAIVGAVYFITSYQIPNLNVFSFFEFIFKRLGFGQMAGVFNTFSLPSMDGDYYLHIVPFASILVDYPIYQKDLMLYVMNTSYEKTGIQNSLFISEAYGIGGWGLAVLSPFIMGVSYFFGIFVLYIYLRFGFGESVAKYYILPMYLSSMSLTGGFSSFPLLKGVILIMILLFPLAFVWKVLQFFSAEKIKHTI